MTPTIYLSAAVIDRLEEAQRQLDLHLGSSRTGRCSLCQEVEPCERRGEAEQFLARYGRLPRRTPGLTLASPRNQVDGYTAGRLWA